MHLSPYLAWKIYYGMIVVKPFTLLIKPSGSDCNINCKYCFYKDRPAEFGRGKQRMSIETLEALVRGYVQLGFSRAGFAWQGGEPTLMGVDFFQRAVELQKKYGTPGQEISNTFQTNGIALGDRWCRFFHQNKFLLGISIDGPEKFHDRYRTDHSGAGTFAKVMRGIESCKKHRVEFNTLILLNDGNVGHPDELFDFAVKNELTYLQFIPCIERDPATGQPADFSITPGQYGDFLCRLFDLWCDYGPEKLNIREFDSLTTFFVLGHHTVCTYSENCAGFVVVEHNGDAFCCEFFVEPKWRLGNVSETPLEELAAGSTKLAFAEQKTNLSDECTACPFLKVCRGGCVKDRTRLGGRPSSQNYFCESYKQFFDYALITFMEMAKAIKEGWHTRHTRPVENVRIRIPDER